MGVLEEALAAWNQNPMGTAVTPPMEWIIARAIELLEEEINEVKKQIADLES